MRDARSFWQTLSGFLEAGEKVFLALVAENTRHSPGTVGARLLVTEGGERVGTIGGGIMEFKLLERARGILEEGVFEAEIQTLHHSKSAAGERSGMICAGSQTNLYRLCRPSTDSKATGTLDSLAESGHSGTLTISPEGLTVEEEPPDLERAPIRLFREGATWSYEEELLNRKRLAIFGGGHCALALARAMKRLRYDVAVYETRENVFADELREVAQVSIVEDFRQAGPDIGHPELTNAVVMTTDFPSDVRALAGTLRRPFPFLGVMGAPAKVTEIKKRLAGEGFTDAELAKIQAPIGFPIPSHTPEEIAVSVAAQILSLRSRP